MEEVMQLFAGSSNSVNPSDFRHQLSVGWVTMHIQKDKRITLGTAIHSTPHCSTLKGRTVHNVQGDLARHLPVCGICKLNH